MRNARARLDDQHAQPETGSIEHVDRDRKEHESNREHCCASPPRTAREPQDAPKKKKEADNADPGLLRDEAKGMQGEAREQREECRRPNAESRIMRLPF